MLNEWILWLTSLRVEDHLRLLALLLLVDGPRYTLTCLAMCLWDIVLRWCGVGRELDTGFGRWGGAAYTPSVCVLISAHNEAGSVRATLASVCGSYPGLRVVFVDDGSTDATLAAARRFADAHGGVRLLHRARRGGKASAYNFARGYTSAEVLITIDCDSEVMPGAIREVVRPMADPRVGVVSGNVGVRNAFANPLTWLQGLEYMLGISVSRRLSSRLGTMGVASGAFAAFRRSAVERIGGWDVGPGEDSDITLRLRKAGWRVVFAPHAWCITDVPTRCRRLFRQRCRWNRSHVRELCRKHLDLGYPWARHFRLENLALMLNGWIFQVAFAYTGLWYLLWLFVSQGYSALGVLGYTYAAYTLAGALMGVVAVYYSRDPGRDALLCAALPAYPLYCGVRKAVRAYSMAGELLLRRSYHDEFYPAHVRAATWRW